MNTTTTDLRFEGVNFNTESLKKMTLTQLLAHNGYKHLWPKLKTDERKARLTELHKLVNKK